MKLNLANTFWVALVAVGLCVLFTSANPVVDKLMKATDKLGDAVSQAMQSKSYQNYARTMERANDGAQKKAEGASETLEGSKFQAWASKLNSTSQNAADRLSGIVEAAAQKFHPTRFTRSVEQDEVVLDLNEEDSSQ